MPPKAKTSKKRARSPAGTKAAGDKAQTRSSKRTKKDAFVATLTTADKTHDKEDVVDEAETTAAKTDEPESAGPTAAAPSFHGNFDLYAMKLPFLNSVFTPKRDYAALLKLIRTYQAKPDNSAQIFLPEDIATAGQFRSRAIEDPLEGLPFDVALESAALKDSLKFTAREDTSDAYFSEPPTAAAAAGLTASVKLEDEHCGISSSKGTFKMRRAWVDAEGTDEVFEGFFSINVVYSGLYRRKCQENSLQESFAFWAIRARVGEDGKEIGLGSERR
ncbi:hypothetical protein LXA43DRAFT_1178750 [Ganoderma leucocontextum]|nr:hypothetical protein LXA43DRAFT_1178750 [Ganoderma leucocontextum]